jgi:hypothetical protein
MDGNDQLAFDFGASWMTSMETLQLLIGLSGWCKVAAETVKEPFTRYHSGMQNPDDDLFRRFVEMRALTEHVTSLYLADAAIIVFAHSVLDGLINSAVELSIKVDISVWQERILKWSKNKTELKYPLSAFRHNTFIDLLRERSSSYLRYLCDCSLPNKIQVLLDVLKPSPEMISDHQFKLETLETLTTLRNTVIHKELLGQTFAVDYLLVNVQLTGYFIKRLVVVRHSLSEFAASEGIAAHLRK